MNAIAAKEGILVDEIPYRMSREFNAAFNSLIPELTEDLKRIDFRLQTITSEAVRCGVFPKYVDQLLHKRFWSLVSQITGTEEKHDKA